MRNVDVDGGNILIFGDLHLSDVFTGKHKNYLSNCFDVMEQLDKFVEDEKPSAIVLLGDIVGWTETNIRNREVLSTFCKYFKKWSKNGTVKIFAVRGNHDMKGYPDFQLFADLGFLTISSDCNGYFDYYGDNKEIPEIRFHLVDYKDEDKSLNIETTGGSNIVLAHNNFTISGITNWYAEHDGIELGMLQNFSQVDMVISGHIHNPSPEIVGATMPGGKTCSLLYPGCPTRPIKDKNIYESCWVVKIAYNKDAQSTDILTLPMELAPVKEVFYGDDEFVTEKTEAEVQEELRIEALQGVLGDLLKYRMNTGDPLEQVDRIPNASDEAKKMAKEYLLCAINCGGK